MTNNKQLACYIDGLVDMVNQCSESIGLSYIKTYDFDHSDYIRQFKKFFEIEFNENNLYVSNESLNEAFTQMMGDDKVSEGFLNCIEKALENCEIIRFEDEHKIFDRLGGRDGLSGLYFVEDLFFVRNDDIVLCFILGNNE